MSEENPEENEYFEDVFEEPTGSSGDVEFLEVTNGFVNHRALTNFSFVNDSNVMAWRIDAYERDECYDPAERPMACFVSKERENVFLELLTEHLNRSNDPEEKEALNKIIQSVKNGNQKQ